MKKVFILIVFNLLVGGTLMSQIQVGILNVTKPAVMDTVMWRLKKLDSQNTKINGYRIMIFQAIGRGAKDKALSIKSKFLSIYPNYVNDVLLSFEYPRYEIVVGKFRKRIDAFRYYKKIKRNFPNAVIIDYKFNRL